VFIISYLIYKKNLLQVQKGLSSGKDTILPQADDWGVSHAYKKSSSKYSSSFEQHIIAAIYMKYDKCEYIKYSASVGNNDIQACNKKGLTN
jgi:hypothetical protein